MNKKKYSVKGQNVYLTESISMPGDHYVDLEKQLFAIATDVDNALEIAATLNAVQNIIKSK